ncbi:hypothetical protein KP509_14G085400 [Ceratopteris richardii]|uniref:Uncharacterized protein n=1 Tax=Ceratopteris richardii TaxID=49495 RepID=A0A8T2TF27_CERRI|nr:hypothetical protein KP509_14G085400 [Ceratopteris richardii]
MSGFIDEQANSPGDVQCPARKDRNGKKPLTKFGIRLKSVRICARTIGALHSLSCFVALLCLTWTTAVLLGAFAGELQKFEFSVIVFFLFIEAFRLRSMHFLMSIVRGSLSQDSAHDDAATDTINHKSRMILRTLFTIMRRVLLVSLYTLVQMAVVFPSFLQFYFFLPVFNTYKTEANDALNLGLAIGVFRALLAINSVLALIQHSLYTLVYGVWHMGLINQSVLMYFHMVLEDTMRNGVSGATDINILSFAYSALAEELRNGRKVKDVVKRHKKLICYLFCTTIGVNSLIFFINDRDPYVQMAAFGIAGLWAKQQRQMGTERAKFELPEAVLRSLIKKIDTEEVGRSAAHTVIALSNRPEIARRILRVRTCQGKVLAGRLIHLLELDHFYILPVLRTFAILYDSLPENEMQTPPKFYDPLQILSSELMRIFAQGRCHRVRTCAGYLMQRLGYTVPQHDANSIEPKQGDPWLESEKMLLQKLRIAVNLSELEDSDFMIKETPHRIKASNLLRLSKIGVKIILFLCFFALNGVTFVAMYYASLYLIGSVDSILMHFQRRF